MIASPTCHRARQLESVAVTDSEAADRWWEGAVIYQVYPRSYADANGDGIGDLRGILARLDHLRGTDASLGVDALWLSPIYPSPLHDFGYDISDYVYVAPEYGTLADLDALVEACHARGLRFLLDLVPCHTSIQHPWFVESRSSRDDPRRDWYIWADPAPAVGRHPTGRPSSAAARGSGTRPRSSTTSTRSTPSSPT